MASFGQSFKINGAINIGTSNPAGESANTYTYNCPLGCMAKVQILVGGNVAPTITLGGRRITGASSGPHPVAHGGDSSVISKPPVTLDVGPGQALVVSFTGASSGYVSITGVEYANS
jgi:hypothetical protein